MDDEAERSLHLDIRLTRKTVTLFFCIGLFMVSLVMAALTSVKLEQFHIGGLSVLVPAGTIAFGLTYLATDAISEVWGRSYALCVVLVGLVMRLLMMLLIMYALYAEQVFPFISATEDWTGERQAAFESVFRAGIRLNIAGMIAFGISACADVLIFHYFQKRDAGKNRLWFRNNFSTITSQILNSVIFISAGFLGAVPMAAIGSLILGQIVVKIVVAALLERQRPGHAGQSWRQAGFKRGGLGPAAAQAGRDFTQFSGHDAGCRFRHFPAAYTQRCKSAAEHPSLPERDIIAAIIFLVVSAARAQIDALNTAFGCVSENALHQQQAR